MCIQFERFEEWIEQIIFENDDFSGLGKWDENCEDNISMKNDETSR